MGEYVMRISTQAQAEKSKTTHQFVPGTGYISHAAPPVPALAGDARRCLPPEGTEDGSAHMLRVPGGGTLKRFTWVAAEQAWERPGGARLAFEAAYLSGAGWTYGRAATAIVVADLK